MLWNISHDKDELSLDSYVTGAKGESQLEFSVSLKEDKYLPSISWESQPAN